MEAKGMRAVQLQYYAGVIDEIEGRLTTVPTSVDGSYNFKYKIDLNTPIKCSITFGDQVLFNNKFIAPGDSVSFDFSDNEQIHIEGTCKEPLSFQMHYEAKYYSPNALKQMSDAFNKPQKVFADFCLRRVKEQMDFMNSFFRGHAPEPFKTYMESEIRYGYALALLQYSWKHANGGKAIFKDPEYMKLITDVNANNPAALVSSSYVQYLRELPYSYWRCHVDPNNKQGAETKFYLHHQYRPRDSIAKKVFVGRTYEIALYHVLHDQIKGLEHFKGGMEFEDRYKAVDSLLRTQYRNSFVDKGMLTRLANDLSFVKAVAVSVPAPEFAMKDINGRNVKLTDYRGRVVYLSFWTTANEQCVNEIALMKGLHERYKDKNVAFVYVNMDAVKANVTAFMKVHPMEGTQLLEPKGMDADVAKKYTITTMPRHVLIDKKGFIINRNAPGPDKNPTVGIDYALAQQ